MAPLSFKMKALKNTPFSSITTEEELTRAWRVCTSAKEAIENGSRLENLSWRLWFAHKAYNDGKIKSTQLASFTEQVSSLEIDLGRQPPNTLQEIKNELKRSESSTTLCQLGEKCTVEQLKDPSPIPTSISALSLVRTLQSDLPFTQRQISSFYQQSIEQSTNNPPTTSSLLSSSLFPLDSQARETDLGHQPPQSSTSDVSTSEMTFPSWVEESLFFPVKIEKDSLAFPQPEPSSEVTTSSTCSSPSVPSLSMPPSPKALPTVVYPSSECSGDNALPNSSLLFPFSYKDTPLSPSSPTTLSKQNVLGLDGSNHCANCGTTTTPLWRRSTKDELLCNACGLYWKMHHTDRPHSLKTSSRKDSKQFSMFANGDLKCSNCETKTTPLWRRDENGDTVCNACGLYLKLHHSKRPISMKTDVIKKRNRYDQQLSRKSRKERKTELSSSLLGSNHLKNRRGRAATIDVNGGEMASFDFASFGLPGKKQDWRRTPASTSLLATPGGPSSLFPSADMEGLQPAVYPFNPPQLHQSGQSYRPYSSQHQQVFGESLTSHIPTRTRTQMLLNSDMQFMPSVFR